MRRFLAALIAILLTSAGFAASLHRGVAPVSNQTPAQTIASVTLDNQSFIPNGTTAPTVGNVVVTMSPAAPAFSGVITICPVASCVGTDPTLFQTNPLNGTYPSAVQALASTAAGTYHIKLTATPGGNIAPLTSASLTITGTAANVISTFSVVNDSGGATQLSGQPTQTFSLGFKDGDICGGTAPKFLDAADGTTVQKFSASPANARRYYNSGCLMRATFSIVPAFSVAASASHSIQVSTGGTWPANSSRTLTEVYNQHLLMNFPAIPSVALPYSDTFSINLNGDVSQYRAVKWLDGDAGAYWKISTKAVGGNASPHRVGDFYIQALNNSSGGLGGFRWLGNLRQPFYNLDTPTKTQLYLAAPNAGSPASGTNWQVNAPGGGTSTTALTWPYGGASQAFTVAGGVASTNSANTFFQGSNDGRQVVPVLVRCGPCPSGLLDNNGYFVLAINGSRTFNFANDGTANGTSQFTPGDGTGTITPIVFQSFFERFTFAGADAKYLFFQGSGSISAETTLRVVQDKNYLSSTGLIPPYNLTYTAANLTYAGDQSALNYSFNWSPYSIGNLEWSQSAAGNQQFIGPLPNAAAVDFMVQTKTTDDLIRKIGLSAGLNLIDLKTYNPGQPDHDQPLNLLTGTYTGLSATGPVGAASTTVSFEAGLPAEGFTTPAYKVQLGFDSGNFEHKPRFAAWAYMKTGELQYLDYIDELAQCSLLCEQVALRNPNNPSPRIGVATAWGDSVSTVEARAIGWGFNDQAVGALVHPFDPTNPDALDHNGTQYGKYGRDATANSVQIIADIQAGQLNYFDAYTGGSAATNYFSPLGFWTPVFGDRGYSYDMPEWQRSYVWDGVAWAATSGNTTAKTVLRNDAVWLNHVRTNMGGYGLYGAYENVGDGSTANCGALNHCTKALNTHDNQFAVDPIDAWVGKGLDVSSTGFTVSPTRYWKLSSGAPLHYTLQNGDLFVFTQPYNSYTIRDFDGTNFNIYQSDDAAHTVIPGAGNAHLGFIPYMPGLANNACPGAGCNVPFNIGYPIVVRHNVNWRQAILGGDANSAAVQADAENRMANDSSQGPVTELFQGARWAIQNHFGP